MLFRFILSIPFFTLLIAGCTSDRAEEPVALFVERPAAETGIEFSNDLSYTESFNPYTFRNFFNGGGVGVGDVNNDGLPDLFFCGNIVDNKLYLNKGNFQFEDITERAGVASPNVWSSGVSMVDIDGDGWLDIYVCKSGAPGGENRNNELFINNGDLTFTEASAEYGLDNEGLSTHAAFFDYDRDGDLDCYLLNNSLRSVGGYDLRPGQRELRDTFGGNKFFRNEGGRFVDVSEEVGIYGSAIGFGLGVTIGDVNRDGWSDIFVSNDFFERDYLYLNEAGPDGRRVFRENLTEALPEISMGSMGADMADLNNDGYPEIFVTDMLPEDNARMKTKTAFENWNKYQRTVAMGYHHQFTRNVLQLNNTDGTFSEIGRMAGVNATDWSWGALIADFDNDGRQDIFVANGIYKDLTDQDYINFYQDPATVRKIYETKGQVISELIDAIPSEKLSNYLFLQTATEDGVPVFENVATTHGLGKPTFSNGSAYADLDNDGDLDLIVNNVADPAGIYENRATDIYPERKSLTVAVKGTGTNTGAVGTQIELERGGQKFYRELNPMRGFESNVDARMHIGLGVTEGPAQLTARFPDGTAREVSVTRFDTLLTLRVGETTTTAKLRDRPTTAWTSTEFPFRHTENEFSDFDRERLVYHMLSGEGPGGATADLDGDGDLDVFIGGAKGQSGQIFLQENGEFLPTTDEFSKRAETVDALFFDANGDQIPDLYIVNGGSELPKESTALRDELYFGRGDGSFEPSKFRAPKAANSVALAEDIDGDGDLDLFTGERTIAFSYGTKTSGSFWLNDGQGNFSEATENMAPALKRIGMITDAAFLDHDGDGDRDLMLVGEYMAPTLFENDNGKFAPATSGLEGLEGWWHALQVADLNGDGLPDLVAGNHGTNSRFRASAEEPITLLVGDFDDNGSQEHILSVYNEGVSYPLVLRHDLVMQLPGLKKQYLKYEAFRDATVESIFSEKQRKAATVFTARELRSGVFLNRGGRFEFVPLPARAQLAPVYAISAEDTDGDGQNDLLLGGNFRRAKPETGKYEASYGLLLRGDGTGRFTSVSAADGGIQLRGEIRDILPLDGGRRLVLRNDEPALILRSDSEKEQ